MKRMGLLSKRIISATLSLSMLFGMATANVASIGAKGLNEVQAASAVTRESIHDGTILHAFSWNFNTIKEKMPEIAAAGYTAVQTSPINECLSIHPGMALYGATEDEGRWYYHYQPTDWKIGNYQLGSRDEFKAMCDEAEKYGIGVIVDIDPNHTTPVFDQVSDDLKAAAGGEDALYHIGAKDGGMAYDNRISVTYDAMGGLPDVDTENSGFQQYFYEFLQDCIACGADGFRIDTAKHIALPDDGVAEEYAGQEDRNNFYPNMKAAIDEYAAKDYADLFVYGEVLDGDAARVAAYQDMLGGTCASNYGGAIRNAVSSGSVSVKKLSGYKISDDTVAGTTYVADSNKLVTWVESHDNYINDGSYNEIDDRDVILGWAIITAREDGTPLFFSRPDGSSQANPWGNNLIGAAGSDLFKAPEVVAVNKFRTAMEGEAENLRNPGNNSSVLMIERGNKGVVIVNASENDFTLDSETELLDGNYLDSVEGREEIYTVADGNITGTVPAKSVVVLDKQADGEYSTLFFHNTKNWSDVDAVVGDSVYNCDNQGYDWWKVTIPQENYNVVFTGDGEKSDEFKITKESGKYLTANSSKLYFSKAEAEADLGIVTKTVYFLNTEEWTTVNSYAWLADGTQLFGGWPGQPCSSYEGNWVTATVKMVGESDFSIIFNGEDGQTVDVLMDDMSKNYLVITDESDGKLVVSKFASMAEAEEATGIGADSITVHYYNAAGWDKVGVYTWGDIELGGWPGQECEYEGDGWWKKTIDASPSSNLNIIFNNMPTSDDDKHQTDDMKADSLKKVYFVGAAYKFGSKKAAEDYTKDSEFRLEKGSLPAGTPTDDSAVRAIEEEQELAEDETRVYVKLDDAQYFNGANAYIWTDGANVEHLGGWPGKHMAHIGNNWYSLNVPKAILNTEDEEKPEEETADEEDADEAETEDSDAVDTEDDAAVEEPAAEDVTDDAVTEEPEAVTEETVEEVSEEKSVIEEVVDSIINFVKSAFSPMEAKADEHNVFTDGIHVIVNNGNGYQDDNVNSWFTTVRPSDEELKQEEPSTEPEEPVDEPINPEPTPVDPEPTTPDEPVNPDPSTPVDPQPTTPDEPSTPEPTTPVDPEPETPVDEPVNPEPTTPEEPTTEPEKPEEEQKPVDNTPTQEQKEQFKKAVVKVVKKVVKAVISFVAKNFGTIKKIFGW